MEIQLPAMTAKKPPAIIRPEEEGGPGPRFCKTSFLTSWLARAARLPGNALHLAVLLVHRASALGPQGLQLPGSLLNTFGVSPDATSRALDHLEHAGLVQLRRRVGHRPLIDLVGARVSDPR
jgi:hypothetical protein